MAFKTSRGFRSPRRPETQKAVELFEKKTGLKVLSARCRTSGSMRPYVNLLIEYSHEKLWNEVRANNFSYQVNGQSFEFLHSSLNNPNQSWIDVRWTQLGLTQPF